MISIILPSHKDKHVHAFVKQVQTCYPEAQVLLSLDDEGKGKGWAIRQAMKHANGKYIAFMDSDGDIEPRMLQRLLPYLQDYDVVVGSKRINHKLLSRRFLTVLSRIYIQIMFGIQADTQTGLKIYDREYLHTWDTDGFLFDVEVLLKAKKKGARIIEVPIEAEITKRMSCKAILRCLRDSLSLKFRS